MRQVQTDHSVTAECTQHGAVPSGRHCPTQAFGFVAAPHTYVSRKDEGDKLVVLERGDVVMVFNFHPTNSYQDYRVGCLLPGPYKVGYQLPAH